MEQLNLTAHALCGTMVLSAVILFIAPQKDGRMLKFAVRVFFLLSIVLPLVGLDPLELTVPETDVSDLGEGLEELGVSVTLSDATHHPHDAGAYRRSRQTAMELLKDGPGAIFDIHRDGIPDPDQYAVTIGNKKMSKVRLLVGKGNQNKDANLSFAKQIKAVADKMYPGLIKDIYMGKGAYNQDLAPRSVLLEFGTHTLPKERVLASTGPMSEVVYKALYGGVTGSAGASDASRAPASETVEGADQDNTGAGWAVWLVVALVAGLGVFAFLSTGGRGGMSKWGRSLSEMTGGLFGKKPPRDE